MIRKIFSMLFIVAVLSSCGNSGKKDASSVDEGTAVKVEFTSLIENPESYVNKNMIIQGKVVHVCPHTGKKMFIVGDNPDIKLYIEAGEESAKFPMELLGSVISVEGKLTKMVTPEKPAGDMAMETGSKGITATGEACETEAAVAAQPVLADLVLTYKTHEVK
jgi:hypothetical protein